MKEKMMGWLMGLLSVALIAGNLTYVSAGVPDVDAADSRIESILDADMSVSGNDVSMPGEAAFEMEQGVSALDNDTFGTEPDASIPGNDEPTPETGTSVSGNDAFVSESDPAIAENDASVSGNDAGEMLLSLDSDVPWTLDGVEIEFSRQYQAIMLNPFGQYYCVDFDDCPEAECDILFGSKYAKASDLDIYVYSDYQGSWVRCSFDGWELVAGAGTYTIQETNYPEENHAIRQYDPRTYEFGGRTYRLADADLTISSTISKDPAVWGDDEYHGVSGGCYWFADEGLLIVSGELLPTPKINVVSPPYKADYILYANY